MSKKSNGSSESSLKVVGCVISKPSNSRPIDYPLMDYLVKNPQAYKDDDEEDDDVLQQKAENDKKVEESLSRAKMRKKKQDSKIDEKENREGGVGNKADLPDVVKFGDKDKKSALEKLRQMEWKRNVKDHSEITQAHLRKKREQAEMTEQPVPLQKDKDEVYFSGTMNKSKPRRVTKRRETEVVTLEDLNFTKLPDDAPTPTCDPSNPWNRKKGSELFPESSSSRIVLGEDEDAYLKIAIQESIQSAAEENKRYIDVPQYEYKDRPREVTKQPGHRPPPPPLKQVEDWDEVFEDEKRIREQLKGNNSFDSSDQFWEPNPEKKSTTCLSSMRSSEHTGKKVNKHVMFSDETEYCDDYEPQPIRRPAYYSKSFEVDTKPGREYGMEFQESAKEAIPPTIHYAEEIGNMSSLSGSSSSSTTEQSSSFAESEAVEPNHDSYDYEGNSRGDVWEVSRTHGSNVSVPYCKPTSPINDANWGQSSRRCSTPVESKLKMHDINSSQTAHKITRERKTGHSEDDDDAEAVPEHFLNFETDKVALQTTPESQVSASECTPSYDEKSLIELLQSSEIQDKNAPERPKTFTPCASLPAEIMSRYLQSMQQMTMHFTDATTVSQLQQVCKQEPVSVPATQNTAKHKLSPTLLNENIPSVENKYHEQLLAQFMQVPQKLQMPQSDLNLQLPPGDPTVGTLLNDPRIQTLLHDARLQMPQSESPLQVPENESPVPVPQLPMSQSERILQILQSNPSLQVPQTDPSLQVPQSNPRLQVPQSDPRLQVPQSNPSLKVPQSDPRLQVPQSDPRLQVPQSDPRLQVPQSDPRLQVPQSDPRLQVPQSDPRLRTPQIDPRLQMLQNDPRLKMPEVDPRLQMFQSDPRLQAPQNGPRFPAPQIDPRLSASINPLSDYLHASQSIGYQTGNVPPGFGMPFITPNLQLPMASFPTIPGYGVPSMLPGAPDVSSMYAASMLQNLMQMEIRNMQESQIKYLNLVKQMNLQKTVDAQSSAMAGVPMQNFTSQTMPHVPLGISSVMQPNLQPQTSPNTAQTAMDLHAQTNAYLLAQQNLRPSEGSVTGVSEAVLRDNPLYADLFGTSPADGRGGT